MKPKMYLVGLLIALTAASEPAIAKDSSKLRTDRIEISYVAPKNSEHEELYGLLKERRVLERIKGLLSPLRLPRPLLVKTAGCDGDVNAFYDDDVVTVCYEYIAELLRNAPRETTPAGVTRQYAIVGPTIEVFLHELGHAIFDYHEVPILGREEDAADQLAAYFLLQFDKANLRRLIAGVAYSYKVDASQPDTTDKPSNDARATPTQRFFRKNRVFADEHELPAQRFYNILCMAYGAGRS
jgi:Putative metallopeptidase